MVMECDCKHSEQFQNHGGCTLRFRAWRHSSYLSCFKKIRTVFIVLLKCISLFHLCEETEQTSFQEQVLSDTIIFFKSAHYLCFENLYLIFSVTHQFYPWSFLIITSTCSSNCVQNAVVKHVSLATAIFHDTFVQIRQRRPSGWA